MKRGALHLAGHSEGRLIEALAEGIPMIVENAESLERVARSLFEAEKYQASEIIRGFAEEEAAKVLILLDALRCPKEQRSATLKCFYQHLPKRIYALTCGFSRVWTFGELGGLVARPRAATLLPGRSERRGLDIREFHYDRAGECHLRGLRVRHDTGSKGPLVERTGHAR